MIILSFYGTNFTKKGATIKMHIFSSCDESVSHCLDTQTFGIAHLYNTEPPSDIHVHDCYEIYYSIAGGKQFLINEHVYDFSSNDIFFINNFEPHYLQSINLDEHERIVIHIHPKYLKDLSTLQTDLEYCFTYRNDVHNNRISMTADEQKRFLYFINQLSSQERYGQDILDHAMFLRLMVFLNDVFIRQMNGDDNATKTISISNQTFHEILSYINQHLSENLSIQMLADHFYLSPSYLCTYFKTSTGTTIKKYIIAQRINLAKSLLASGHTTSEACELCGFKDYSNFYKTFTKMVGISPKSYSQISTIK